MKKYGENQDAMFTPQNVNYKEPNSLTKTFSSSKILAPNKILLIYVLLFIVFILVGLQKAIPIEHLFRDPLAITNGLFYFGLFSNIGILLWCASATVCFFSFLMFKRLGCQHAWHPFLLASGSLTLLLLLDDFFLLHEVAFPDYLGISSHAVVGTYGAILVFYLARFYKRIQKTNYKFLIFALVFMAGSIFVDLFADSSILSQFKSIFFGNGKIYLIEDSFKFFGIVSWLIYFVHVGLQQAQLTVLRRD